MTMTHAHLATLKTGGEKRRKEGRRMGGKETAGGKEKPRKTGSWWRRTTQNKFHQRSKSLAKIVFTSNGFTFLSRDGRGFRKLGLNVASDDKNTHPNPRPPRRGVERRGRERGRGGASKCWSVQAAQSIQGEREREGSGRGQVENCVFLNKKNFGARDYQ